MEFNCAPRCTLSIKLKEIESRSQVFSVFALCLRSTTDETVYFRKSLYLNFSSRVIFVCFQSFLIDT